MRTKPLAENDPTGPSNKNQDLLLEIGKALRVVGRQNEALDHLRNAVAIDPTLVQSWNSLGLLAFDFD
jgi:Flp pilus assembly protein TadD